MVFLNKFILVDASDQMMGTLDLIWVCASFLIILFASYSALSLAKSIKESTGLWFWFWYFAAVFSLGAGIWSMHFVAMLAMNMGIPITYDSFITVASIFPALVSAAVLFGSIRFKAEVKTPLLVLIGTLAGLSVSAMHLIGMEAMIMKADLYYRPVPFLISQVIAIVVGLIAAKLVLQFAASAKDNGQKILASFALAIGVSAVHFSGVWAASFVANHQNIAGSPVDKPLLALFVSIACIAIASLSHFATLLNQRILLQVNEGLSSKIKEQLLKQEEAGRLLRQRSKMADMGEMIAMIVHQWRQPLSVINVAKADLELKLQLDKLEKKEALEVLEEIQIAVNYMDQTMKDFRNFFRPDLSPQAITVEELVKNSLSIVGRLVEDRGVTLVQSTSYEGQVETYLNELLQVMVNIIKNALDVIRERNTQNPKITITAKEQEGKVVISICDNAGGIPEEHLGSIFEQYYTTKGEEEGTGLGLYMSKIIVNDRCGGSLKVENLDDGACFTITLPLKLDGAACNLGH